MGKYEGYNFYGCATKANTPCSDGRTILPDAFADCDGKKVPLVWNHQYGAISNVLGHCMLENRSDGVYAYGFLNNTAEGLKAKEQIEHGDITALSICANNLTEANKIVKHGTILEVSLVLAGANIGAHIDNVIRHGETVENMGIIYNGDNLCLMHSEEETKESNGTEEDSDDKSEKDDDNETVEDVINSMTDKQKALMYSFVGMAVKENNEDGGEEDMKHNVFDGSASTENNEGVLTHAQMETIIKDAKRFGSMKESFIQHADEYGITNIDYLFPDAQKIDNTPQFIQRDMDWVTKVMSSVHHTPFSRIKSIFADITADEARAKGYIKGNKKVEEVFSLLKRTTTPTTVYKKQKLDRDDIVDITDFDVLAWLKTEMRMMLNEELARAYMVGDGRLASSDDKINESNIRPVWTDDDLFTIKYPVTIADDATEDEAAKAVERAAIKSRKDYKGSGNPTFYTTEEWLTNMLLREDNMGRKIYGSVTELATAMRVKEIVTVEVFEGLTRTDTSGNTYELIGLIVNMVDYNVGADKGGAINMFDDFDIDYNQQKYLIETRCSGALTKPYSAIALEKLASSSDAG